MADFQALCRYKPLGGQIWTGVLDTCWFVEPFGGSRQTLNDRWAPHMGNFYQVDNATAVEHLLQSQVALGKIDGGRFKFADVLEGWQREHGAKVQKMTHSGDAKVKSFVSLQVQHDFLNLMRNDGLKMLNSSDLTTVRAKSLRQFLGLGPQVEAVANNAYASSQKCQDIHFKPEYFARAAELIAGNGFDDENNLSLIPVGDVLSWLRTMETYASVGPDHL